MAKPTKIRLRNKADKLLQEYIKASSQLCWVCGEKPVSCGHHFILKSRSYATRYYLPNIIPICRDCHCLVHSQPSLAEPRICFKLGQVWYEDLIETKRQGAKFTKEWITIQLKILEDLMKEVKKL